MYPSEDGYVGKVKLLTADGNLDEHGKCQSPPSYLNRPIHKLVLLLTADEVKDDDDVRKGDQGSPHRGASKEYLALT